MNYHQMVRQIAKQEQVSEAEVKKEIERALAVAGIKATPEEFIRMAAILTKRLYIV